MAAENRKWRVKGFKAKSRTSAMMYIYNDIEFIFCIVQDNTSTSCVKAILKCVFFKRKEAHNPSNLHVQQESNLYFDLLAIML